MTQSWDDTTLPPPPDDRAPGTDECATVGFAKASLVVLVGPDAGRAFEVEESIIVGRSLRAQAQLSASDVSREHAIVERRDDGHFWLRDSGSRNGTAINGVPITEQRLEFGDKIRIGNKTMMVFSQHDGTEEQLLQSLRLASIGQLAGGVAHDFNNLLGAILANVGFLAGLEPTCTLGESSVAESLKDVRLAATRAAEVVQQLLGQARRSTSGRAEIDAGKVVAEVGNLIRRTFPRSITVQLEVDPKQTVHADPSQVHQALMNLCINARDAMPHGGTLRLTCRPATLTHDTVTRAPALATGSYVEFSVADTGTGMAPDVCAHVFDAFFTTKAHGKGTGLGLSTVRDIVAHHAGEILVDSAVGKGTLFRIWLPAAAAPAVSLREVPGVSIPRPAATRAEINQVVMVVDDDEVFLNASRRLIEGWGYPVHAAPCGDDAVATYTEFHELIGVVLLDLVMADLDGEEVFRRLRAIDEHVRVVICTGQVDHPALPRLRDAGVRAVLHKPYDAAVLSATIAHALALQRT